MTAPTPTACRACDGSRELPVFELQSNGTDDRLAIAGVHPCPMCCCTTCGQPCEYPPECRDCAADSEAAAKRASDR